jgi:hypothetical protein
MLSMTTLSPIEQAVLRALSDACYGSLGAHVPKEAVAKRLQPNLKGEAKKQLKKLRAKGYCIEHPTGGNTTWQLTPAGLAESKNIL